MEVVDRMLRRRGATAGEGGRYVAADGSAILVLRVEKLTIATLREVIASATQAAARACVILVDVPAGAIVKQAIAEWQLLGVDVEVFTVGELCHDIMRHELQPRFEVLTDAETAALLRQYNLKSAQLPRLLLRDPCARYLNLKRGQVVRITRTPQGVDAYHTYRVVL
jgi:DNA-directed RNA polymerase I, II, and III subunit RPABC1